MNPQLLFSDYFEINSPKLDKYGALNVCLEADLPLFIDPFLLFSSDRKKYQKLHGEIVGHLVFLRNLAVTDPNIGMALFQFPEVKQNWLGVCKWGNKGKGLGPHFARNLVKAFNGFYKNFGSETLSESSHIEKLTLVGAGIGRDFISDFAANLMLEYLLKYTQKFAKKHLEPNQRKKFSVRCSFNEELLVWTPKEFELPYFYKGDREEDLYTPHTH